MKTTTLLCAVALTVLPTLARGAQPALTIYNQNFAVVRDTVPLDLKQGVNDVRFSETTAHLEPDSVILRDPQGKTNLQVLEQNYRNDPVSRNCCFRSIEGKTIEFETDLGWGQKKVVQGKIIRSGYVPHSQSAMQRYGQAYYQSQMAMATGTAQPIIEVDGKLQFSLPGKPVFPVLTDDTILKPEITWKLNSDKGGKTRRRTCVCDGRDDLGSRLQRRRAGEQRSARSRRLGHDGQPKRQDFENAKIKLMAGDVSKIQPGQSMTASMGKRGIGGADQCSPTGHRKSVRGIPPLLARAPRHAA